VKASKSKKKQKIDLYSNYLLFSSLLEYAAEHRMTQPMIWHFLYQISQVKQKSLLLKFFFFFFKALDFLHSLYYVHMDVSSNKKKLRIKLIRIFIKG
jgi:hypothetical protein